VLRRHADGYKSLKSRHTHPHRYKFIQRLGTLLRLMLQRVCLSRGSLSARWPSCVSYACVCGSSVASLHRYGHYDHRFSRALSHFATSLIMRERSGVTPQPTPKASVFSKSLRNVGQTSSSKTVRKHHALEMGCISAVGSQKTTTQGRDTDARLRTLA
jgi:hypothetical protein